MTTARPIGVTILGCGTVGSATAEMLLVHRRTYAARTGCDVAVRHIVVREKRRICSDVIPRELVTTDANHALSDPEVQLVIELIGGIDDARSLILRALAAGKHVVTANKALLALHGPEIFAAARAPGRCVAFEAAVGGGIPLIETLRRGLIANEINAIFGILNGTSNYILSRMSESRVAYADALLEAQRLGYAEADPTLDVSGVDTAHKLTILASIAMRRSCEFARLPHRGITDIEVTDLIAGEELGYVCKLLAVARRHVDTLDLSVQPTFIHATHPLASVRGPFNAVSVYGSAAGHTFFYGRGAGARPTASAVIADVIDVASGSAKRVFDDFDVLPDRTPAATYRPCGEHESVCYIRVGLADRPGGMAAIATALGDADVSIASLVQHQPHETHQGTAVPVVVVTHPTRENRVDAAIDRMAQLDAVIGRIVRIPIMDEHVESNQAAG